METKDFWAVLIICLVVSGIVAFGTVKLTGDVIKVSKQKTGTEIYTKTEIDTKIKQSFSSCSPSEGFGSGESGIQVCKREQKTCLFGTNFARLINETSSNIVPLHFKMLNCSQTQEDLYENDWDYLPSNMKIDVDPSWICCKV